MTATPCALVTSHPDLTYMLSLRHDATQDTLTEEERLSQKAQQEQNNDLLSNLNRQVLTFRLAA
jgi:hypothetical protein